MSAPASRRRSGGSLRALTDSSGAVVGTMAYTPFGAVAQATGTGAPQGFTGEFQDNNLVYLRARYYHPTLGRFLTRDSLVPDATNGQDWNAYAYVRNDPWNWVDPSGQSPLDMVSDLGDQLSDAWRWARGRGEAAQNWWNKPRCGCQGPMDTRPWQFAGIPPTIYLGFVTSPVEEKATITLQEQRRFRWGGQWGRWRDRQVISHGPLDQHVQGLRGVDPQQVTVRPPQGLMQRAYRLAPSTRQGPRLGLGGLGGALGFGAAIDAGLQAVDDLINNRCLSPGERAARIAVAGAFGLGVALIGAAVSSVAVTLGAGSILAASIGIGASLIVSNVFLVEPRARLLDRVTHE